MQVNLFFDWVSNGELLTLKTGPPCSQTSLCVKNILEKKNTNYYLMTMERIVKHTIQNYLSLF